MWMLIAALSSETAEAKDLRERIGIGAWQAIEPGAEGGSLTHISLRYGLPTAKPTLNLMLELDGGFRINATDGLSGYAGGLRFLSGVVVEDNMNLYLSLYLGYQHDYGGWGALRALPMLSAEFFPFGLDNLGISADLGVRVDAGTELIIATQPALGLRYYF